MGEWKGTGFEVREGRVRFGVEDFGLESSGPVEDRRSQLRQVLMELHPWRKGPMWFGDLHVDTEWRSDWKWERLRGALDLSGKRVLDVGCGNGYHLWRMLDEGVEWAVGVDPVQLYGCQFLAGRQFAGEVRAGVLPLTMEEVPEGLGCFDAVFSLGVLYHRKEPEEHLRQLRGVLREGGEVVLETLIVDDEREVLVPEGRYAQMRNVHFLPSVETLLRLMEGAGFGEVEVVDITRTTVEEQRSTEWMRFHSLAQFLDENDGTKTVEGHPAPVRAAVRGKKI
ncbi:MAG: tRNA 5-methoxyuridine(34)/uridine 5-oxyacetic acid(34) synthase CmoB [Verrucomicrobiota bacterium]